MKKLLVGLAACLLLGPSFLAAQDAATTTPAATDGSTETQDQSDDSIDPGLLNFLSKTPANGDTKTGETGDAAKAADGSNKVSSEYKEEFLASQPIQFGGSFNFSGKAGVGYKTDWADWNGDTIVNDAVEESALDLSASLYFDVRPSASSRYYGSMKLGYPFDQLAASLANPAVAVPVPSISVWELFTDFNIQRAVFFRVGKQIVNWGVGYFFQPADIISLTPVDVANPTATREGPIAIKANIPFGMNLVDAYIIAPSNAQITSIKDLGLAARLKLSLDLWSFSLGVGYQKDHDWQFVATANGGFSFIDGLSLFGEAKVNRTALGNYLDYSSSPVTNPVNPLGPTINHTVSTNRDTWFFSGTVGASYSISDWYLTLVAQYYYNGEGYDDAKTIAADAPILLAAHKIGLSDLLGFTGKHYVAASISESFSRDSDVSVSAYWVGNLSDGSGTVSPSVNVKITSSISLSGTLGFSYGDNGTQFRGLAALGSSAIFDRVSGNITLRLGSGEF